MKQDYVIKDINHLLQLNNNMELRTRSKILVQCCEYAPQNIKGLRATTMQKAPQ